MPHFSNKRAGSATAGCSKAEITKWPLTVDVGPKKDPLESQIVTFRAAGREDDLFPVGADQRRYSPACILNRLVTGTPDDVIAGWVSIMLRQEWQHCFLHAGGNGGRRVVVEIDLTHRINTTQFFEFTQPQDTPRRKSNGSRSRTALS